MANPSVGLDFSAEDIQLVQLAAEDVLVAALVFQARSCQDTHGAYTQGLAELRILEAAIAKVLEVIPVPPALEVITFVRVSSAAEGVVEAAKSLHQGLAALDGAAVVKAVVDVRAATNRILHVVKVRAAAREALVAAKEFEYLATQGPSLALAKDQAISDKDKGKLVKAQAALVKEQAAAFEDIRVAITKVTAPEPNICRAAGVVKDATKIFLALAFEDDFDAVKIQAKLKEVRKATKGVSCAVDEDQPVLAYKVAKNLAKIFGKDKYKLHRTALLDWQRRDKDLFDKVSRRQSRSADLTNQIYNIIGWFGVFQGVVLTAVSQLSDEKSLCPKIWFPIALTLFGALVTIGGILHKFKGLKSLELTINTEKQAQSEVERRISTLRIKGPRVFCFNQDVRDDLGKVPPKGFAWGIFLVFLSLVVLTVLFILSYIVILCDKLLV